MQEADTVKMSSIEHMVKIGIVGAGMVGSASAYALALRGPAQEIVLVDQNNELAVAQAEDIDHAIPFFSSIRIRAGTYEDLEGAAIIVIAAGVSQKPGETRIELLERNLAVFRHVISRIMTVAPDAILLIATNPVDIMTDFTTRLSGLPASKVIGTGTMLDTARFRTLLAHHLQISPQGIHAHVLGEHGDSEVLAWSSVRIGGLPLEVVAASLERPLDVQARQSIDTAVRNAAYHIIRGKGATYFGIGGALQRLIEAILRDENAILTVTSLTPAIAGVASVTASIPRVIGRTGIVHDLPPNLDEAETRLLYKSTTLLKSLTESID
ncbi:L-lactate dehydrogenase [Allorhizobium sp. BGMRC 0089]|uniref:L-lactate dehydrogenase n=1 Tax=Allorhizobium sonneratiae TaxID=2934936 RepID=UPI0020348C98|nr:L-lactate dehydrogenase [Allorhizobium sonneratiae]MCM2293591.1 L-lactate dehydrogenase [Allorhizobium sonneratiae]